MHLLWSFRIKIYTLSKVFLLVLHTLVTFKIVAKASLSAYWYTVISQFCCFCSSRQWLCKTLKVSLSRIGRRVLMGSRNDPWSQNVLILFYFISIFIPPKKSRAKGRAYYGAGPVFKLIPVMSSLNLQRWGILSY